MDIATFLGLIATGATSAATAFVNLFSGLLPVFWTAAEGSTPGGPTIVTIFLVAGIVMTLAFWGIDKLFGLGKLGLSGISKARAKRSKKA